MKKIYKSLTADQLERGVIFSSVLIENKQQNDDLVHEVFSVTKLLTAQLIKLEQNKQIDYKIQSLRNEIERDNVLKIDRLLNDTFFDNSPYTHNLIRK